LYTQCKTELPDNDSSHRYEFVTSGGTRV